MSTARYALVLWVFLALFCGRVVGQFLVATLDVPFLPPMEEWYSGLVPYPPLLASQFVIIALYGWVAVQFTRGRGWITRPNARFGRALFAIGGVYLVVMVVRYVARMSLYPMERWTGGSIPIFFHWILAGFLLTVSVFHLRRTRRTDALLLDSPHGRP